jgi:hypothetical protein
MRIIYGVIIGLSLFSCSSSLKQDNKKPINEVEIELIKLVNSYFKTTIGLEEDFDFQLFSNHFSPEYKEYICKEAHTDNFDSTMNRLIQFSQKKIGELREKGAIIQVNDMLIKEKFQKGDTLAYLIQTEMLLTAEIKNKKLTNKDYILAVSSNYGIQWYIYQADIPNLKNLIKYQLDKNAVNDVINLIVKHKPNSKMEKLK